MSARESQRKPDRDMIRLFPYRNCAHTHHAIHESMCFRQLRVIKVLLILGGMALLNHLVPLALHICSFTTAKILKVHHDWRELEEMQSWNEN